MMATRLPETLAISDQDEHLECPFCVIDRAETDPDDMDRWAAHLTNLHGYRVREDIRPDVNQPRTIRVALSGWSTRAKFQPNTRVNVSPESRPRDYAGRRGTIVGWNPHTSEYAVAFDTYPTLGWLSVTSLTLHESVAQS
jgi:hypothetical protein